MSSTTPPKISRRTAFAGAGAAGALAAAAAVLPGAPPAPVQQAAAPKEGETGYRLTEHVKRYYATARV